MRRLSVAAIVVTLVVLPPFALASGGFTGTYGGKLSTKVAKYAALNGSWKLAFSAGGKYAITRSGAVLIRGTAAFGSSGKITFGHESGPAACPASQPGRYHYAIHRKTLAFSVIKDACGGRLAVLTLVSYKRS